MIIPEKRVIIVPRVTINQLFLELVFGKVLCVVVGNISLLFGISSSSELITTRDSLVV
ncbi:hypothetical protein FM121_09190 [Vagococcus fluvialis bH819]|uniref:Uncharacterized protein n=1 Tax=Vagococcus fluvialis bH819 TaxID=1255619 RepID=A0A1X6WPU0_9ENTE|nr:hypothetical protein FM121_09190 [Vagococcus fluvialis bH819]